MIKVGSKVMVDLGGVVKRGFVCYLNGSIATVDIGEKFTMNFFKYELLPIV